VNGEDLQGTVVITGASGGIGSALVADFLDRGHSVVAIVQSEASEAALLQKTGQHDDLRFEHADLSSPDEVGKLTEKLAKENASVSWLVHCAGYIETPETDGAFEPSFQINTFAPMMLSMRLKEKIAEHGGVLFFSSTAGLWGSDVAPIYAASKSALHGFAFSLQKILGKDRRSIVVCPGPTNTPMREKFAQDGAQHQSPETVANLILDEVVGKPDERDQKLFVIRKGAVERIAAEAV
jgi:NAD(P)-dependent dehydrogenase (short-subunit alcohol dehydrogenase family)